LLEITKKSVRNGFLLLPPIDQLRRTASDSDTAAHWYPLDEISATAADIQSLSESELASILRIFRDSPENSLHELFLRLRAELVRRFLRLTPVERLTQISQGWPEGKFSEFVTWTSADSEHGLPQDLAHSDEPGIRLLEDVTLEALWKQLRPITGVPWVDLKVLIEDERRRRFVFLEPVGRLTRFVTDSTRPIDWYSAEMMGVDDHLLASLVTDGHFGLIRALIERFGHERGEYWQDLSSRLSKLPKSKRELISQEKARERARVLDQLSRLSFAERLEHIARDTEHSILWYPVKYSDVSQEELGTVDHQLRQLLIERLSDKRQGPWKPWKTLCERLLALPTPSSS